MKVLVTGAAGFVGRALVPRLLAEGFAVRAALRSLGSDRDGRVEWLEIGDIAGAVDWPAALEGIDTVVHLAALAHQVGRAGRGRAAEFMAVNADATRRLAQAAREAGVTRFVLLGSVAVIGPTDRTPVDERVSPCPDSDYGRSKLGAERELAGALARSGVAWSVLRAPLVFGPGNPGNMARLLRLVQRGWPLPFGAIDNARSFLYVDNLIDAIVRTVRIVPPLTGIYFVDDGTVLSTGDLCRALAGAAHLKARLLPVTATCLRLLGVAGDIAGRIVGREVPFDSYSVDRLTGSSVVNGTRFREATGWQPPVATAEAIRRTVESVIAPTTGR